MCYVAIVFVFPFGFCIKYTHLHIVWGKDEEEENGNSINLSEE
jgi:hypothetical protein